MHTEKQRIFDEYAKERSKNLNDFRDLILNNVVNGNVDYIINHICNVCDLVQQEQQKRIDSSLKNKETIYSIIEEHEENIGSMDDPDDIKNRRKEVLKSKAFIKSLNSIPNPENLIK